MGDSKKFQFFFVKMSDDRFDNRRYYNEDTFSIQSTAGAVPVRNKKGEVSMEKVKVSRYISGKRPEYASRGRDERSFSESDSSDEEDFTRQRHKSPKEDRSDEEDEHVFLEPSAPVKFEAEEAADIDDPRLRRLRAARSNVEDRHAGSDNEDAEDDRMSRHRRIHEPEVLSEGEDEEEDDKEAEDDEAMDSDGGSTSGEEDLDEAGILRRRELMRQRALARAQIGMGQEEVMAKEEEKSASEHEDEDETTEEETTDSEGEEGARLKPVFVRKKDRLTVQEREREEAKQRQAEREAQILAEQRRRDTLRMVESAVKLEASERKTTADGHDPEGLLHTVNTDDENEEVEYEAWKLRELKRLKRDRDENEERAREAAEVERLRNMTEEERRLEQKLNPKKVTNKAAKGKYKFLQKYYHRGAFFLDKEENVFSRDVTSATLEDKFDKTVLPKVMQVKNFGRSGRTKYTHLVDQDTTQMDAAWSQETQQNLKFQVHHAAGMKSVFERPSI